MQSYVVDRTGLTGRYDFELEWTRDETQFGGTVPTGNPALALGVQAHIVLLAQLWAINTRLGGIVQRDLLG